MLLVVFTGVPWMDLMYLVFHVKVQVVLIEKVVTWQDQSEVPQLIS